MSADAWTDERREKLEQLWPMGLTARQIADQLGGGLSRNAVISKAHRLGLSQSPTAAAEASRINTRRATATRLAKAKSTVVRLERLAAPQPPSEPVKLRPATWAPNEHSRPWTERAAFQCRWPVDGGAEEQWACCRPTMNRYCEEHSARAYIVSKTSAKEYIRAYRRYA